MLLVALAEAAALVVMVIAFAGLLRSQQRAHARREDLLVNQLLHAAGRAWATSPADRERVATRTADVSDEEYVIPWTPTPEQLPVL